MCLLSFLKKHPPTQTHPLISIHEFSKPYELLFLEFESFVKCKIWIVQKISFNNFICHLSWPRKLSPTHTYPLISICEFLKPYNLLFLEFESFIKYKIWIVKNSLNNLICHLSWLRKLFSTHTHPLKSICEFPLISIVEFLKPYRLLFFQLESFANGWMQIGKKLTQ